ncbi:MAG TPA: ABC transporter permease subunit [Anaerolineae bacterium]|nr:ABC transporter permease subunit [Anaerolineae bacterium]
MKESFRFTLARLRGQVLGWSIAMLLLSLASIPFYDGIVDLAETLDQFLQSFPPELMALFGNFSMASYVTPEGYLGLQYFDLMAILILGIFAILIGSGLIASDEENGRLDLILAHPVSRTALIAGRLSAFVAATLGILVLSWLGIVVPMEFTSMDLTWGEVALPFLSLFAELMLFGTMALLLSMLLPSRRAAASAAGFVLIASYVLVALARMPSVGDAVKNAARLSPLTYYQSGEAIEGLNLGWFLGLLALSAVLAALSGWLFQRRDIRVGGEGGWRLSLTR